MAIVEMSKLSIVGLNADKRAILSLLIEHGLVQIDDSSYLLEENEYGNVLQRDSAESEVIQLDQKISLLGQCLESIKNYVTVKKAMFAPKREYQAIQSEAEEDKIFETAVKINMFHRDLESAKNEENMAMMKKEMLLPWASLDVPLHQLETKYSKMILGTFPTTMKLVQVRPKLEEVALESIVNVVKSDKQFDYCYVISHKDSYEQTMELLEKIGMSCEEMKQETRKLIFTNEDLKLKFFLSKASDVPTYVEYGAADIGVVGKDTILEEERNLYEVLDLQL